MSQKLTEKIVKALEAPPTKNGKSTYRIEYDTEVKGFGARITSSGAISFVLNYRRKIDGRERRDTIGAYPTWSVEAARDEAAELKRRIRTGGDPVGEDQALREAPTVADLCKRFKEEHLPKKRASTQRDYTALIKEIEEEIGTKKVAAVEFTDIDKLHNKVSKRAPWRANRMAAVLSKMFNLAIRWKWRPDNPVKGVERNQEPKRKRYLTVDELARLMAALDKYPNQQVADIFRLLLLTGARRGEVLSATWDQFDLERGIWTKPAAFTKQKEDHQVPLSAPARQLLVRIRRKQDDEEQHVFPGSGEGGHRTVVKKAWARIIKAAKITNLRIHDLRHSYASTVISAGWSLPVVGALLGHTQPSTTQRYAHLVDDVLAKATATAGAILSGKKKAQVVTMRGRR